MRKDDDNKQDQSEHTFEKVVNKMLRTPPQPQKKPNDDEKKKPA